MTNIRAGLDGVTFLSAGCRLLGGLYIAAGDSPRPTAILLHGLPGIEKNLDIAYDLRDRGWNCLYFHFRGSWGSHGRYSLDGLTEDVHAAITWVKAQPVVDPTRIAVIGCSTGSHPALLCAASDPDLRAVIGISPVVTPAAFTFPPPMATAFASMLTGTSGDDLLRGWLALPSLIPALETISSRPVLLVAAEEDDIFPPEQYAGAIAGLDHVQLVCRSGADHGFSACRPWLAQTVAEWLISKLGA